MKLWQKIFIGTLVLVMLAVQGTAMPLLSQSQRMLFQQEQKRASSEHSYMLSALQNTVAVTRLRRGQILMDEEDTMAVAADVLDSQKAWRMGGSLYRAGVRLLTTGTVAQELEAGLVGQATAESPCFQLQEQGNKQYLLIASWLQLETRDYVLVTATDVSELDELRREQLRFTRTLSILFSLICALLLLIMVWWLMRPLQKVNHAIRRIAQGDYQKRLHVRGHSELAELAQNTNRMAISIEQNVDRLEQAADNQKTFIANLTHEMKTPLTSILGFADILRIKKVMSEKERREYANVIVEETKRLKALSGKLMELITLGNTQLDFRPLSLRELVSETALSLQPSLALREIGLRCDVPERTVSVDKELFKSLLYNLVDNAAKASQPGQIVEILGDLREGRLVLVVRDFGMGIPQKEIPKIIQPFYMLDKVRSRQAGGAGLGLALCAEIAKLHHVELSIESEIGKGTRVYLLFEEGNG